MRQLMTRLWQDDEGAVISVELILVLAILVFGIIPGLVALRNSIVAELTKIGNAITSIVINVGVEDIGVGPSGLGGNTNLIAYADGFTISMGQSTQLDTYSQQPTEVFTATNASPAPATAGGFNGFP